MHFRKNLDANCSFYSIKIFYNPNRQSRFGRNIIFLLLKVINNVCRLADRYVSNENENLVDKLINLIESEKIAENYIQDVVIEC